MSRSASGTGRLSTANGLLLTRPPGLLYNTLVSYSTCGMQPLLSIRDLGLDLNYASRTVVSFCGTILEHQVSSWGVGDRICYAHFMWELVRKRLDVSPAGWVKQEIYLSNQF